MFFVSLVVLDPLVVVLVAFVLRAGIWLAVGVIVLDVAANWIGNWSSLHEDPARLLRPVGLLPITLFGVFGTVALVRCTQTFTRNGMTDQRQGAWVSPSERAPYLVRLSFFGIP